LNKEITNKKFQFFLQEVEKHFKILDKNLYKLNKFFPLSKFKNKISEIIENIKERA